MSFAPRPRDGNMKITQELDAATTLLDIALSRYTNACSSIKNHYKPGKGAINLPLKATDRVIQELAHIASYDEEIKYTKVIVSWASNLARDRYVPKAPTDLTGPLLRALVAHAPTERGQKNICEDILECGAAAVAGESHLSERLYDLGQHYVTTLIVPILQGDRTTRDGWVDLKPGDTNLEATIDPTVIEEAKRDVKKTKALALVRDDYRCLICGLHDILVYQNQPVQDVSAVVATTAAPILPFHLGRNGDVMDR
ncbi:hypothetical protein RSOLAG22IIIB_06421 [Rhizoctonia solani]|uniref:Uncharacterized protein n=1 Tax=Rhizoctonia solani TaxID=456999 RepID=A0A0K6GF37_9AGAM|nr:hypothetical protein RSOLAG22IIIB_06421 [Rhizoctonia solani]